MAAQEEQPAAQPPPAQPRALDQPPRLGAASTTFQGTVIGTAVAGPAATGLIRVARV